MSDAVQSSLNHARGLQERGDLEGAIRLLRDALKAVAAEITASEQRWSGLGGVFDAAYAAQEEQNRLHADQAAVQHALDEILQKTGRKTEPTQASQQGGRVQTDATDRRILDVQTRDPLDEPESAATGPKPVDCNKLVLQRGTPMKERLETAARLWEQAGRSPDRLLTSGEAYFLGFCWVRKMQIYSPRSLDTVPLITEYVAASLEHLGGEPWWDGLLEGHEYCSMDCGMRWRLENLSQCTECLHYVCPQCDAKHSRQCGGELVG
jgi:uncharacterized protein YukE